MKAEVTRYQTPGGRRTRFWAVMLDGELLAVTVYRKGARAVAAAINSMELRASAPPVNPHANGTANKQMVKNMVCAQMRMARDG
jgi:hypothetical protein